MWKRFGGVFSGKAHSVPGAVDIILSTCLLIRSRTCLYVKRQVRKRIKSQVLRMTSAAPGTL